MREASRELLRATEQARAYSFKQGAGGAGSPPSSLHVALAPASTWSAEGSSTAEYEYLAEYGGGSMSPTAVGSARSAYAVKQGAGGEGPPTSGATVNESRVHVRVSSIE